MSRYYFGYGSNLNLDDLRQFEKRYHSETTFVDSLNIVDGIYFLVDYQLHFPVKSTGRQGGVLSVYPKLGHVVAGKLFEIDDEKLLDAKEGSPFLYQQIPIKVISESGDVVDAFTYVVNPQRRTDFEKPHTDYVSVVSKGMDNFQISKKYPWALKNLISAAENKPCTFLDHVFVYGTLLEGECREQSMKEISTSVERTKIRAKMFDVGSFPAIVSGVEEIVGELHTIKKSESLNSLDRIEGFIGYDDSSLYHRKIIFIDGKACWTYFWNGSIENLTQIKSGDWKRRNNESNSFDGIDV